MTTRTPKACSSTSTIPTPSRSRASRSATSSRTCPPRETVQMAGENVMRVFGLDGDYLQKVAVDIGAQTLAQLADAPDPATFPSASTASATPSAAKPAPGSKSAAKAAPLQLSEELHVSGVVDADQVIDVTEFECRPRASTVPIRAAGDATSTQRRDDGREARVSSAPFAIAFFTVSVRINPGRVPWKLPLYSSHSSAPRGLVATWSISTPSSATTLRPCKVKRLLRRRKSHCCANWRPCHPADD